MSLQFGRQRRLDHCHVGLLGGQRLGFRVGRFEFASQTSTFRLQRGNHVGVGGGIEGLSQRPLPLPKNPGEPSRPLHQPLDPTQRGGQIGLPLGRQLVGGPGGGGVELIQRPAQGLLGGSQFHPKSVPIPMAAVESPELGTSHVQAHRPQLVGQIDMGTGGRGLAFEGSDLPLHLAHQVAEALEVFFGRCQSALRALSATAEFENAGGFLDHRPPVLGPGIKNGVELTLAHDDMLLTPNAGVGEKLLHVEKTAGGAVDGVLAVAGSEQGPGDGDLGQVRGQLA